MFDISEDVESLTEFKRDTSRFTTQLAAGGVKVLTINGRAELAVMSAQTLAKMMESVERLATLEMLRESLDSVDAGKGQAAAKVFEQLDREFGYKGKE